MTNLSDIIERLEKAEAGSRELDALIWCHFAAVKYQGFNEAWGHHALTQVSFTIPPKRKMMVTGYGRGSNPMYQHAEPVTTSVDAAISLASKVLPGWCWLVRNDEEAGAFANVTLRGGVYEDGVDAFPVWAKTPALALCLAILKTKAHLQEGAK